MLFKMMKSVYFQGLTFTLILAFLSLSTVIVLISGSLNIYNVFHFQQEAVLAQQQLVAQNATNTVSSFIQERFGMLEKAASLGNLADAGPFDRKLVLNKLLGKENSFRQLLLLNAQGRALANVSRLSLPASKRFSARTEPTFFSRIRQNQNYIGAAYVDEATSEPMVIMAVPAKDVFGDFKGTLLAEVNLKSIWDLIERIQIGKQGLAYVVDRQGNLLAFRDISRVLKRENLTHLVEVGGFVKGDQNAHTRKVRIATGILGARVVSSHVHLGTPDWAVVVELPAAEAFAPLVQGLIQSLGAMLLSFILAILAGFYLFKRISQPLVKLRNATREISKGNLKTKIAVESKDEIGELAESFNQMVDALNATTVSRDSLLQEMAERKKVEEALFQSAEEFRLTFEYSTDAIFWADVNTGLIIKCNQAAEILLDKTQEEIIGQPAISVHPPNQAEYYTTFFQKHVAQKGAMEEEAEIIEKSGKIIPVLISTSVVSIRGKPIIQGIFRDLRERKQAEGEKVLLQTQLLQAQKLEAIGQLAAGIAHEINTPTQYVGDNLRFLQESLACLGTINRGYTSLVDAARRGELTPTLLVQEEEALAKSDLPYLTEEVPKAIQQSLEGLERVTSIVRAMKDFAHPDSAEKALTNLNEAIASTVTVARNEWKYLADLETDFDPSLPPAPCFVGEFNQAILNLIINAAHAIGDAAEKGKEERGLITIRTRQVGAFAEIRVTDTGTGIPDAVLPRIFDPFFTTKRVGRGTGQGLTITRQVIVGKHNGSIDVETRLGEGTTFILKLPLNGSVPNPGTLAPQGAP